jgi:putative endonuclease
VAARHLALGAAGEEAAAALLAAKGLRVLARNWRSGGLELDLVCREGRTIVFVEVKTRGPGSRGTPADGLTPAKRGRLVRAASLWLSENEAWDAPCRFDLVAVTPAPGGGFETVHLPDAMTADGLGFQPFA